MGQAATSSPQLNTAPAMPVGDSLIATIASDLAAGGDLAELLQRVLEPLMRIAAAQGGSLRLLDESHAAWRWVHGVNLPSGACSLTRGVDRHCGACGQAADSHEAVWVDDVLRCGALQPHTIASQGPHHRMLVVPLQHRGEVLGVYSLYFGATQTAPATDVLALLRTVGELLGLALNHARLERAQLQAAVVRERQSMAADVHDSLGQSLMFMKMRVPLLEDALHAGDKPRALGYCADLRETASQSHASLRLLLTHLRVPMDPQGLWPALQQSAEQFRRRSATKLDIENNCPDLLLQPEQEAEVFHIVQEALANVARHAGAQHAWLRIGRDGGGELRLSVEDDGTGLAPPSTDGGAGTHYGLAIMQERAARLGGELHIGARHGGGTRVQLRLPTARDGVT